MSEDLSSAASNVNWLVNSFVSKVPGVSEAVVVTSDGLPMATSEGLDRDAADRFAAVASGLIGLAYGAAGRFGGGAVNAGAEFFAAAAGQAECEQAGDSGADDARSPASSPPPSPARRRSS